MYPMGFPFKFQGPPNDAALDGPYVRICGLRSGNPGITWGPYADGGPYQPGDVLFGFQGVQGLESDLFHGIQGSGSGVKSPGNKMEDQPYDDQGQGQGKGCSQGIWRPQP